MLPSATPGLKLPKRLAGRFHVGALQGQGGIAQVVRAYDEVTGRDVALKVLFPNLRGNDEVAGRFRREVAVVQRVNHPNVVPITGVFEDGPHLFLVMPLLAGDLQSYLDAHGPLSLSQWAILVGQLCAALTAAHGVGVIHRDIKPQNILHDGSGKLFALSDFGLARVADFAGLTTAQSVLGTPEYMAPEVVRDGSADPRSDLYSLALVLYEAATGRLPFLANTPLQMLHQQLTATPPSPQIWRPDLPTALCEVLLRTLQKEPLDRYGSALEFGRACAEALKPKRETTGTSNLGPPCLLPAEHARCSGCGHVFVRDLGVCTRCGQAGLAATVAKGSWCVQLQSFSPQAQDHQLDSDSHVRLLRELEHLVVDREVLRDLQKAAPRIPSILARGIDLESAQRLSQACLRAGQKADILTAQKAFMRSTRWRSLVPLAIGGGMVGMKTYEWVVEKHMPSVLMAWSFVFSVALFASYRLRPYRWSVLRFRTAHARSQSLKDVAAWLPGLKRGGERRLIGRAAELGVLLEQKGGLAGAGGAIYQRLGWSIKALLMLDDAEAAEGEVNSGAEAAQSKLREGERLRLLVVNDLLQVVATLESLAARCLVSNHGATEELTADLRLRLSDVEVQQSAINDVANLLRPV